MTSAFSITPPIEGVDSFQSTFATVWLHSSQQISREFHELSYICLVDEYDYEEIYRTKWMLSIKNAYEGSTYNSHP